MKYQIVVIGGSAGSIPEIIKLLQTLPSSFTTPVVIVVHRVRNAQSDLDQILSEKRMVEEPEDKARLHAGGIYLAPQNYHLLIENDNCFSLDYSEPVHFSRPAIDVTFQSAAATFGRGVLGIILSGANKDGAEGMAAIAANGGTTIAQSPDTAAFAAMPNAAINATKNIKVLSIDEIAAFIEDI